MWVVVSLPAYSQALDNEEDAYHTCTLSPIMECYLNNNIVTSLLCSFRIHLLAVASGIFFLHISSRIPHILVGKGNFVTTFVQSPFSSRWRPHRDCRCFQWDSIFLSFSSPWSSSHLTWKIEDQQCSRTYSEELIDSLVVDRGLIVHSCSKKRWRSIYWINHCH
jgi:hypothetical protein